MIAESRLESTQPLSKASGHLCAWSHRNNGARRGAMRRQRQRKVRRRVEATRTHHRHGKSQQSSSTVVERTTSQTERLSTTETSRRTRTLVAALAAGLAAEQGGPSTGTTTATAAASIADATTTTTTETAAGAAAATQVGGAIQTTSPPGQHVRSRLPVEQITSWLSGSSHGLSVETAGRTQVQREHQKSSRGGGPMRVSHTLVNATLPIEEQVATGEVATSVRPPSPGVMTRAASRQVETQEDTAQPGKKGPPPRSPKPQRKEAAGQQQ
jgi:hypothetical protein